MKKNFIIAIAMAPRRSADIPVRSSVERDHLVCRFWNTGACGRGCGQECLRSISLAALLLCYALSVSAQENLPSTASSPARSAAAKGDYASDVGVVLDAQGQALEQARQALEGGENMRDRRRCSKPSRVSTA